MAAGSLYPTVLFYLSRRSQSSRDLLELFVLLRVLPTNSRPLLVKQALRFSGWQSIVFKLRKVELNGLPARFASVNASIELLISRNELN